MSIMRDWQSERELWIRVLQKQTGEALDIWNRRVEQSGIGDEPALRAWLAQRGVTGYAQTLLVRERFGYPDFLRATGDELIERQYADRPHLRPIYDAIVAAAAGLGDVTLQVRKTYVSLVTPRRTFARIRATTPSRVDLGLRLDGHKPGGRLQPSKLHETMRLQISLSSPEEVDTEVITWLRTAYDENR
jgi:hypothetical protein